MTEKKIIILTDDFIHNSQKAAAVLIKELALALNKKSSLSSIVIAPDINANSIKRAKIEGIDTILFPSGKLKNVNLLKRVYNEYMLSYRVKKCFPLLVDEDVIGLLYYSPSIFFGEAVRFFKKKFRCSSYLILRDLFPQWLVDVGIIKKNRIVHLILKYFERTNLNNADRIGVMSSGNLKLFSNKMDFYKYEILYNWKNSEDIIKVTSSLKKYGLEKLKDKFVFFYGGNIGSAQGIDALLDLANSLVTNKRLQFLFIGKGDAVNLIINRNLSNVTYIDSLSQKDYFELVSNFDVGLFSLHRCHKAHNFPGKLYGYMSMSKPILGIVNDGNDVKELINDNHAGLVCYHNEGIGKLVSHCINLSNDLDLLKEQSLNSHNIILKFTPEKAANQILNFLK